MASVPQLFEEATRAVVQRWTALNLAVSNNWGDGDPVAKREALVQQTVHGFLQGNKAVDPSELEQFLDDFLISQFATEADDESPYEVSHLICRLFALINAGNVAEAQSLLASPIASLDACIAESSDSEGSSEEDEGADTTAGEEQPRKEPEEIQLTAEQQADLDDGWGVVVKTRRGRRKEVASSMDQS